MESHESHGWSNAQILLGINEYDILVGHRNNNTLDNRRENLIVTTKSSIMIQSKKRVSQSKFRGVTKSSNKWKAIISGKYLGTFLSEEEAAKAWNKAALERYGENAQLNEV